MSIFKEVSARVRDELAKPVTLRHPTFPSITMVFRSPTDRGEIRRLMKKAESQREGGDFDAALLAACNTEIRQYGETQVDESGDPLTFRSRQAQEEQGVQSAREAVRKFIGSDGHVSALAKELMAAAGWGDEGVAAEEADDDDPTS